MLVLTREKDQSINLYLNGEKKPSIVINVVDIRERRKGGRRVRIGIEAPLASVRVLRSELDEAHAPVADTTVAGPSIQEDAA